jgi:SAM-dependent methyltransferase
MPTDNAAAWDRHSAGYQAGARLPTDVAHYGPDIGTEVDLRLLGHLDGKRVLELGCGGAQCSIAFAKQGAHAIGVDFSAEQLAFARRLCEREGVRVELHHGDLADLAFVRADSIDLVFSAYAFGYVDDLNRVFRQVHRVLRPDAPLVFSLPHPAYDMIDDDAPEEEGGPLLVRRSYFDRSPIDYEWNAVQLTDYHHTIEDLFTGLVRSGFRVDTILEPEPVSGAPRSMFWRPTFAKVPRTLIVRARKEGI